jgi:cytochrome c556
VRLSKQVVASLVVALAVGGAAVAVIAADAFQDRHMAMETVGDSAKPLFDMARKSAPFDAAVVNAKATAIADHLKKAATLFPAGSGGGESRAKPEIWTDAGGFEKAMKDGQAAAAALQGVKDEASFGPAIGALGASCKACHEKYRLPKQ